MSASAGCKQLIHGFELDERTMKLMAEQGTYYPNHRLPAAWYGTYPPDWTPELDAFQRLGCRGPAPCANLRKAYDMVSPLPSALTLSACHLRLRHHRMRCGYDFLSRRLASPSHTAAVTRQRRKDAGQVEKSLGAISRKASLLDILVQGDAVNNIRDHA